MRKTVVLKPDPPRTAHVLILGGGFGGITVAQHLARIFKRDPSVKITLVNRDNYFVFVPLLASAAAGSIEPVHVVVPIRQLVPDVHFRAEDVIDINLDTRMVTTVSQTTSRERVLTYDHLVIALGNVINLSRLPGVAQHGRTIKTLGDALAIRNHVLQMFEAADIETDPDTRSELLTFVVAGGGFSGVEMVGELNDMVRTAMGHYRSITRDQVRVILLHSRDYILPEMSRPMGKYALKELRRRGVEVMLNVKLASATPNEAILEDGTKISTRTLIVAVGNAAPPVLDELKVKKLRGKIEVDECMRVPGHPGVWALGDNAIVPNRASPEGKPSPPTAQYALRQGKRLAENIAADIRGKTPKPFAFGGLGLLCLIGNGAGVGELPFGIKLTGVLGWLVWRGVYWSKIPKFGRKLQVGLDWFLHLFLKQELAQLNLARTQSIGSAHFEPGATIIEQGDLGDHFYIITQGEVEIIRERSSGERVVVGRLGRGDHFGETALLNRCRRNATVKAISATDVVTISRDGFATLSETWEQFAHGLEEVSKRRLAEVRKLALLSGTFSPGAGSALLVPSAESQTPSPGSIEPPPVEPPLEREAPPHEEVPRRRPSAHGSAYLLRRDSGGEIVLELDQMSMGRGNDNQIVVSDGRVSRRHALLEREDSFVVIVDLESGNGTWVNGQRVEGRRRLFDGDLIVIGETEFLFNES